MRKFGLQFGAAKINIMEKMGKRDTTETIEMQHESKVNFFIKSFFFNFFYENKIEGRRNKTPFKRNI